MTSTDIDCHSDCSLHESIIDPYPELLCSSAGPPSGSQALLLTAEVEKAEYEISTASIHIARLQDALQQLVQHRQKLDDFANRQRGVLSTLRRVPNEILLAIFEQAIIASDVSYRADGGEWPGWLLCAPWVLSGVCGHWRAVALASPRVWRYFHPPSWLSSRDKYYTQRIRLQLERTKGALISLDLGRELWPLWRGVEPSFLPVAARWGDLATDSVTLSCLPTDTFVALRSLELHHDTMDDIALDTLPALRHLSLGVSNGAELRGLTLPWSQLQTCEVCNVDSGDFLAMLGQLRFDTDVIVSSGSHKEVEGFARGDGLPTTSVIRALTLQYFDHDFLVDVLPHLSTPFLDKLVLEDPYSASLPSNYVGEAVIHFLERSGCTLTHLCLNTKLSDEDVIYVLGSSNIHSVVHLHLNLSGMVLNPRAIKALARSFPALRTLLVCCKDDDHSTVLTVLAEHHRILSSSSHCYEHSLGWPGKLRVVFGNESGSG
ncbi:hypothetical protein C8R46DRAFT_1104470 [Mycena filopes]|nr:hypothetical protein C8R46DRAFT_1104470 [Mycena filopes]